MMQPRRRLECHIGRPAQTNKLDRALRSGKLVRRLAARANLGPASARGYCGNEVATTGQWKFKISLELGWDDSSQAHDLCDTRDLHFDRLDGRASCATGARHSQIKFANPRTSATGSPLSNTDRRQLLGPIPAMAAGKLENAVSNSLRRATGTMKRPRTQFHSDPKYAS